MERAGGITLDRLERFEKALDDIINNYKELGEELEKLRNDGKNTENITLCRDHIETNNTQSLP